ncbi:MAG TPA: DUF4388 domain-containing protein [Pyrinomonadaceae bacterium]|jgi:curved DNA-binding protein CbpA
MKGQISDQPLGEIIREISASRLSGALRLSRERIRAVVYFEGGEVVNARSNLRLHRLSECLRRWGMVEAEHLDRLLTEGMGDEQVGSTLLEAGIVDGAELVRLRARQSEETLRPLLLWTEGEWNFDPRARLDEASHTRVETASLLLESARRLPSELTASRLANDDELISPSASQPSEALPQPTEAFVLSRVDAPMRMGELVSISGLPDAATRQAVYALALAGLLTRERWPRILPLDAASQQREAPAAVSSKQKETPKPVAPAAAPPEKISVEEETKAEPDPREEIEALFARAAGATHYEVLGVGRRAPREEVKSVYYALARRFHPDRFHKDTDAPLRSRIEQAFAKIAQAYEVLKDNRQRANYDLKLEADARRASKSPATSPHASQASAPDASTSPQYRAQESFQQGMEALRHGNRLLAVMHFGESARLVPRDARYRAYYGHALGGDASTRRQAESELKAAIMLDADNITFRLMLAAVYRDLGMRLRAEGELQRALAIEPQHAEARRMLDALRNGEAKA